MDADRVLRPLTEAQAAIDSLDTYESPAALTEALRATWHGVDRTLRTMLREDPSVPNELRLTALSQDLVKHDVVIAELRRRNAVSLQLAGRVHDLQQALTRDVRADDATAARALVTELRSEVNAHASAVATSARTASATSASPATITAPAAAVLDAPKERGEPAARRRALLLGGIAAIILVGTIVALHFSNRSSSMEQGINAFRHDSMGLAEQHFRAALSRDGASVEAQLYLARVLRVQGRFREAADLLTSAAGTAPQDADVRRELGWLFLDLKNPAKAAVQFEKAVELAPEEALAWVGLVEALTKTRDPRAAEILARAPAEAQQILRGGRR